MIRKEYIENFIKSEIDLNNLYKNKCIYETNKIKNTNISIGVSFESDECNNEYYIYNLFVNEEYININNKGYIENKLPNSVLEELEHNINNLIIKDIKYGSIIKFNWINEINTIMLINNITGGTGFYCCGLDLSSKEILFDCKNINDFINTYKNNIIEKVGDFDELFSL